MELPAIDKKAGMSLGELSAHVKTLLSLAEANNVNPDDVKIKVFINMGASIKTLTAEV